MGGHRAWAFIAIKEFDVNHFSISFTSLFLFWWLLWLWNERVLNDLFLIIFFIVLLLIFLLILLLNLLVICFFGWVNIGVNL